MNNRVDAWKNDWYKCTSLSEIGDVTHIWIKLSSSTLNDALKEAWHGAQKVSWNSAEKNQNEAW